MSSSSAPSLSSPTSRKGLAVYTIPAPPPQSPALHKASAGSSSSEPTLPISTSPASKTVAKHRHGVLFSSSIFGALPPAASDSPTRVSTEEDADTGPRPRRHSLPETRAEFANLAFFAPSPPLPKPTSLLTSLALKSTPLRLQLGTANALPWELAFAYRPFPTPANSVVSAHAAPMLQSLSAPYVASPLLFASAEALLGPSYRIIVRSVGGAGASQVALRFSKDAVRRAEAVMDGMQAEEEDADAEPAAAEMARKWSTSPTTASRSSSSLSSTSSCSSSGSSSWSSSDFSDVGLSDSDDDGEKVSFADIDVVPVVIDVSLDLSAVRQLPASPVEFEEEVARIEGLARMVAAN